MTALALEIPDLMMPFLTERKRHKIARGGRGSAKSWTIARLLAIKAYSKPIRWLCCREVQKSIKQSSHRLIADQIDALGLDGFDVQASCIKHENGSEFSFAGLQDHTSDSIKSYEGYDGAWVEEAHGVSASSANKLIPTIRKPESEIWWSYNPDQEDDFVHTLADTADEHTLVVTINWRDNPWFPDVLEMERQKMQRLNTSLYEHIWEGKTRAAGGILFKRNWFNFYDAAPSKLNIYIASDWAGGPDPDNPESDPDFSEHGVWGMSPTGDLYALDWWYGQEDPSEWIDAWIELVGKWKPLAAFEEKGVILRALDSSITKRMRETGTFARRISLASAGSKAERALGFAARAAANTVYLPRKPWATRLLNQLCSFTGEDGRQDDAVDVCSLIGRGLDDIHNARPDTRKEKKVIKPFTREWLEYAESSQTDRSGYHL